jgi:RHS repeat-associated protein
LLLATVPAAAILPPPSPALPEPVALGPEAFERLDLAAGDVVAVLLAVCQLHQVGPPRADEIAPALARWGSKPHVGAFDFAGGQQHQAVQQFSCKIAAVIPYDVDGVRVRTEVTLAGGGAAVVTEYLVDTSGPLSQVVVEGPTVGEVGALYVRGDDLLAVVRPAGGGGGGEVVRYPHADGLGSVRALTDEAGAVTDRYDYEAFGELAGREGTDPQPYLFAGESLDPNSGWYYNRARWMDPNVGRFGSMDPLLVMASLLRLGAYGYVSANPVNARDPSGLIANLLLPALVGIAVHDFIGAHFLSAPRMPGARPGARFANYIPIGAILGIPGSSCRPYPEFCALKPDLADSGTGEVYEIKPNRLDAVILGEATLDLYLGVLWMNGAHVAAWHPGTFYVPPKNFVVTLPNGSSWAIQTYGPLLGLITYDAKRMRRWQLPTLDPSLVTTAATAAMMVAVTAAILGSLSSPSRSFGF